jgi:hypothetical protein
LGWRVDGGCDKLIDVDQKLASELIDHLGRIAKALERIAAQLEPRPKPKKSGEGDKTISPVSMPQETPFR